MKRMRRLSAVVLALLLMIMNVSAAEKNISLSIKPVNETILSGTTANFILEVKTTGSKADLRDVNLEVELPEDYRLSSKLNDMKIFGEAPELVDNKLVYKFDKLNTGRTQRAVIKIESTNGIHPNGDAIELSGAISMGENVIATDKCETKIEASGSIDVAKRFDHVEGKNKTEAPNAGDTIIWKLRTSVKKRPLGQLYIEEDTKIKVIDTLPEELIYVSDNADGVYDKDTHTITWEFDAPSIDNQMSANDVLFIKDIDVKTRAIDVNEATYHIEAWNKLEASAILVGNEKVDGETWANVVISDGTGGTPVIHGTYYHGNHYGPADGEGGYSQPSNANPTPAVYDNAVLNFAAQYYIHPGSGVTINMNGQHYGYDDLGQNAYEYIVKNGYDWMKFEYEVDDKLLLDSLSLGQPYNNYISTSPVRYLANLPKGVLEFKMNNGDLITHEFEYAEIEEPYIVNLSEILGDNRDVKTITLNVLPNENYGIIDGRIGIPGLMDMNYKVKRGAEGTVANKLNTSYQVRGWGEFSFDYYAGWANNGVRNAIIVPTPEGTLPIGSTGIKLADDYAGVILPGENTLNVEFENVKGSLDYIDGPYELFIKIPSNIEMTDKDVISNYDVNEIEIIHSNGDTIYKIKVDGDSLQPGDKITIDIPVVVKDEGVKSLDMSVYAQAESAMLAPEYTGNSITNTIVASEDDQLVIDGLLSSEQTYLKSKNSYTLLKNEELVIEKQVKGSLDDDWSDFGHTIPGGHVDYKIEMWHTIDKSIDSMVLMDVFPNVGDLGITDNVERDSVFGVDLEGPIALNEELRDLFEVYYSTSENPKRDDLSANTSQPLVNPEGAEEPNWTKESEVEDWSEINSFMIKLKDRMEWPEKEKLTITFRMVAEEYIDKELITINKEDPFKEEKAAWNSAAVAIEDMQVVEPSRVGVAVIDKLEVEHPSIDKLVEGEKTYTTEVGKEFEYTITVELPESVNAYETLTIKDEIDERLSIKEVYFNGAKVDNVINDGLLDVTFDRKEIVTMHRDGAKQLEIKLVAEIDNVTLENNKPIPIENTASVIINNEVEVDVEKPTIVTPEIPTGKITAAVIIGENKIHEVDEIDGERIIGSTVTIKSHDSNKYTINETIETNGNEDILELPTGKYVVSQDVVMDGYIKTTEEIVVEVKDGEITVVEIWNPRELTPAKIAAEKTSDVKEITAGEEVEYTITITNEGEKSKVVTVQDIFEEMIDIIDFVSEVQIDEDMYSFEELVNGIEIEVLGESSVDVVFTVRFNEEASGEYMNVAKVDELTPETPVTVTPITPEEPEIPEEPETPEEPGTEVPEEPETPEEPGTEVPEEPETPEEPGTEVPEEPETPEEPGTEVPEEPETPEEPGTEVPEEPETPEEPGTEVPEEPETPEEPGTEVPDEPETPEEPGIEVPEEPETPEEPGTEMPEEPEEPEVETPEAPETPGVEVPEEVVEVSSTNKDDYSESSGKVVQTGDIKKASYVSMGTLLIAVAYLLRKRKK